MDTVRPQPQKPAVDFDAMLKAKQRLGEKVSVITREGRKIPEAELEKMTVRDIKDCDIKIANARLCITYFENAAPDVFILGMEGARIGARYEGSMPALDVLDGFYNRQFNSVYNALRIDKELGRE